MEFLSEENINLIELIHEYGHDRGMVLGKVPMMYKKKTGFPLKYKRGNLKQHILNTFKFLRIKHKDAVDWIISEYSESQHGPLRRKASDADASNEVERHHHGKENIFSGSSRVQQVDMAPSEDDFPLDETIMAELGGEFKPITIHSDFNTIMELLPEHWKAAIQRVGTDLIRDICLDVGRLPHLWVNDERYFLSESYVAREDIEEIVSKVGRIGSDNRCGFDRELHRVSCVRNYDTQEIIGLTIRVGRHVEGKTDIIRDLLNQQDCSILLLGAPGTGKTTIIREATKILAERSNVWVIDTSNEIAGNGNVPHPCIGHARRMMVPSLEKQAIVMIECIQNHTPDVIVMDEIGTSAEVQAAKTSKLRDARIIASAHGNLRTLVSNNDLRGLVGGLVTVTLSADEAKAEAKRKGNNTNNSNDKQKTQRSADPIFDVIIELKQGRLHEWDVVLNTAKAVDNILDGKLYNVQRRMRDAKTGRIFIEMVQL